MRTLLSLIILACAMPLRAQSAAPRTTRTLFNNPADSITGGYFAFSGGGTTLFGENAVFYGGRLGLGIGHRIAFGLAGYGLANPLRNAFYDTYRAENDRPVPDDLAFRAGYGGLFVEPIIGDHRLVHVSFPITIGAGGAGYGYRTNDGRYSRIVRTDAQAFFFVEPSVEVELNIVPNVRLAVGGAYLLTTDLDIPATDADILRRPMLRVSLKAGQF
ncbi:MAG: hypothetical protein IT230_02950 [Flavobacteriales bacterium]|nr:hypothetical protein [Flavobacteriales bacterium]